MKKLLLAICLIGLFCGCDCSNCQDKKENNLPYEMEKTPPGSKFIKLYGDTHWMKWELNGECFLSYNLRNDDSVLTKIRCNNELKQN